MSGSASFNYNNMIYQVEASPIFFGHWIPIGSTSAAGPGAWPGGGRVRNAGLPVITGNTLLAVACEYCRRAPSDFGCLRAGLGSIHFFQFNSIPIQVGFKIFQFNSILIQIGFRIFQFNSNSIHFLSIPIQFNSNFMHRNKQISQIIGYFKFNLNISLFAAQFRKYIIQDHNNSRINKSALVQVLG